MNSNSKEYKREWIRKWRAIPENKQREAEQRNTPARLKKQREYYDKSRQDPDRLQKIRERQRVSNKMHRSARPLTQEQKDKNRQYGREWYLRNREKQLEYSKKKEQQYRSDPYLLAKLRENARLRTQKYRDRHPNLIRLRQYGMTAEEYQTQFDKGCCICGELFATGYKPDVEHCHTSKIVRGLAHRKCNMLVGYSNEDPVLLRKVAQFCEDHKKRLIELVN